MSAALPFADFMRRLTLNAGGSVAVEFAIIAPVMLVLYFGTFEASRLVRAYMAANKAAQVIANLVAAEGIDGVSGTDSTDFCAAGKLAMAPFPTSSFKATIASITQTAGTIAFDWQDTTCGGGAGKFTNAATAAASVSGGINNLLAANGDTVIVVKTQYSYTGTVRFVLPGTYTINQTAYQRPRSGGTIPHS